VSDRNSGITNLVLAVMDPPQDEALAWKDRSIRLLAEFAKNITIHPNCFPKTRKVMLKAVDRDFSDEEITELVQEYSNERI
jgi:hypothetical protein